MWKLINGIPINEYSDKTLKFSVNGSTPSTQTAYPVGPGTYTVTATDYKNCVAPVPPVGFARIFPIR